MTWIRLAKRMMALLPGQIAHMWAKHRREQLRRELASVMTDISNWLAPGQGQEGRTVEQ